MTPPATTTPESRSNRTGAARRTGEQSAGGHQRTIRSQPAPKSPRRVSGPLRGRVAEPAVPRHAREVKGSPARRRGLRPSARPSGLGARLSAFIRSLPDHALLDRVVRGRAWIPLLGLMLAGIVAMQVEVLKLGAGIGRSIQRGSALQSRNDLLRASVASLADDQRIERLAAGMGMVMPPPTAVRFLSAGTEGSAIPKIQPPDANAFMASLAALAAAAQQWQPVTALTQTPSSVWPTGATGSTAAGASTTGATGSTAAGASTTGATGSTAAGASTTGATGSTAASTATSAAGAATPTGSGSTSSTGAPVAPAQAAPGTSSSGATATTGR